MRLLIASTAMLLTLANPAVWAASRVDVAPVSDPGAIQSTGGDAVQKPDHRMIAVTPASEIVGRDLKDAQGIDAGKISSLVIDTKSGAVEFVMITPPRSLDAGNQLIAAPWSALDPSMSANGPIIMNVGLDKLAKAPRIDPRLIYEMGMQELRDLMYGYYGADFSGSSEMGSDKLKSGTGKDRQNELGARDRQIDLADRFASKPASRIGKGRSAGASALIVSEDGVIARLEALKTTSTAAMHDSTIYDSTGKDVGEFDETMIDVNRGHVAYILVSHGGFLGMDENLYAIPIEALSLSPYRASYRLTVKAKLLEHEPALHGDRAKLPAHVDVAQLAMLYRRFSIQPYWTRGSQPAGKLPPPED